MPLTLNERDEAQALRSRYTEAVNALRADTTLTEAGRRQKILTLTTDTQTQMQTLRSTEHDRLSSRKQFLERDLFGRGMTEDVATYRDAQDRAAACESGKQSLDAMRRALASGDTQLASALAHRAGERGMAPDDPWGQSFNMWLDANGHRRADVEEIASIEDALGGGIASSIAFTIGTPPEVSTLSPSQVTNVMAGREPNDSGGDRPALMVRNA